MNGSGILTTYDILADTSEFVFDIGDAPSGDLTFYKGNLIYQSYNDGNIKAFNLESNTLVDAFCYVTDTFPSGVEFWGASNAFENCSKEVILAFSNDGDIYELDFVNQVAVNLNIDNSNLPVFCFMGSATTTEHLASVCDNGALQGVDCSVSYNEMSTFPNIEIYPNPACDQFKIKAMTPIHFVHIYDLHGKLVEKKNYKGNVIDVSQLKDGIYFVKIGTESGVHIKKIIKTL